MKKVLPILILLISCSNPNLKLDKIKDIASPISSDKKKTEIKNWYHQDIESDSVPGISLIRAYDQILKYKKGEPVVVAVIDMPIDIHHEDLKNNIWINEDEILGNNIDDDDNGYIDDVNGWNFLGNKDRITKMFVNYEYTRILKKYDSIFKDTAAIGNDSLKFQIYQLANRKYQNQLEFAREDSAYIDMVSNAKKNAKNYFKKYFKDNREITISIIDSLKSIYPNDTTMIGQAKILSNFYNYGFTDDYIKDYELKASERLSKLLNKNYNDREITGDNGDDLEDTNYGNNQVNSEVGFFNHGTIMAGLIAAERQNKIGADGFSNNIKIMSLPISAFGHEHDKDIALAIRYAVNNGAKVINMSIGKEFSMYKEWVFEALKYAEEKNVLIVSGGGNSSYDLDTYNHYYPNDNEKNNEEVSKNFIKVGASTNEPNKKLVASFSNYGKNDIDIFAPGISGFSTSSNLSTKYEVVDGGSSMSAALVSGIAALLYSYYPNLNVKQIKDIILESGVQYNFEVQQPSTDDSGKMVSFDSLSKSGKVVNAYNALLMAEEISN